MILLVMIAYEVFAVGLIVLVGWLTYRQTVRDIKARTEPLLAELRAGLEADRAAAAARWAHPAVENSESVEPDDLVVPPEAALRLTVRTHPESGREALAEHVARLIEAASRCEESLGGTGLVLDETGSRESPGRLELRLVPRDPVGGAERLQTVAGELTARMRRARHDEANRQEADLLTTITRVLRDGTEHLEAAEVSPV